MYSECDIHSVEIWGFMHLKYILSTYITEESKTYACNKFLERRYTKNEGVQACVWHVLINQHLFCLECNNQKFWQDSYVEVLQST